MELFSLKGKTALVTGSSTGLGLAIAEGLGIAGTKVVLNGRRVGRLEKAMQSVKAKGIDVFAYSFDVTVEQEVLESVKKIEKEIGPIDILVNNAGITRDNLLLRMSEEDWDLVLKVNLKGAFNCSKVVSKHMIKNRFGRIINIASIIGIIGNAGQANYAASKGGLIALTKSLAKEFASRNINLSRLESRPSKREPWEYIFYTDFEKGLFEQNSQEALEALEKSTTFIKIIGTYYSKIE